MKITMTLFCIVSALAASSEAFIFPISIANYPIPIPVPSKYPTILGICVPGYEKVGSYCVLDYLIPSKEKNPESSLPVTTPPPTPTSPPVAATTQSPAPATVSETTPSPVPVASVSATTVAP